MIPVFMAPLTKKGDGWCGGNEGIDMSFVRGGPKRHKTRRERKWEREKSHRRRRAKWSRWPKMKWPDHFYTVNPEAAEFKWLERGMAADFKMLDDGLMEFRAVDMAAPGSKDYSAMVTGVSHKDGTIEITNIDTFGGKK